jgi:hypothetical protein
VPLTGSVVLVTLALIAPLIGTAEFATFTGKGVLTTATGALAFFVGIAKWQTRGLALRQKPWQIASCFAPPVNEGGESNESPAPRSSSQESGEPSRVRYLIARLACTE